MLCSSALALFLPKVASSIPALYEGSMRIVGKNIIIDGASFSYLSVAGTAFLGALKMACLCATTYFGQCICKYIQRGETPFQQTTGKYMRYISLFLLGYQILFSWENGVLSVFTAAVMPLVILFISYMFDTTGEKLQNKVLD